MRQLLITKEKAFLILFLFGGSSLIILFDQAIKYKIRHFGGFYICNEGISFGLPLSQFIFWLIFGIFFLMSFFYLNYLLKNGLFKALLLIAFILLFGGATSNALDRFFMGCITDFISINLGNFPIFNLADVFIFTGSSLIFYNNFIKHNFTVNKW